MIDQHTDSDDIDPQEEQIPDGSNPELVRQHDEVQHPLDEAIIENNGRAEKIDASPVEEWRLNPPPVDEYD